MANVDVTRREVLTKAAYMAPAIVTLPVLLSFASAGSGNPGGYGGRTGNPGGYGGRTGNPGDDGGRTGNPGDDGGRTGNPGDDGNEGSHKRGGSGRRHRWNRRRYHIWE
jgi:hypothetical protein